MENARIPTSEQLMAEMAWVRQLARALLRDPAVADDVAQDAWLVANEKQPDADRPLRPWLGRVVRNLIRTRRRADARRTERDEAYEEPREVATPEQLVERVELQRAVADEVLALAEPYRSTVLLHFVEGLSSADIARQQRIPDGTVRRRLKEALDRLREALEKRANPPKRGWLAALVPLARLPFGAPAPVAATAGGLAVKKIVVGIALLLLLLGGGFLWRRNATRSATPRSVAADSGATTRTAHEESARLPPWWPAGTGPRRRIAGHVIASEGPVAGARVALGFTVVSEPSSLLVLPDGRMDVLQTIAETTTAADGGFDFGEQPAVAVTVSASAADHAAGSMLVENGSPRAGADHIVIRLGGCDARLSGTISDASGGRIAHAHVQTTGAGVAESDQNGAYSLCVGARHAWGSPSAQVRISADGYGAVVHTILAVADLHLDVQLVPEATLVGHVLLADGTPVAQARVVAMADPTEGPHHLASGWGVTESDGSFHITGLAPGAFNLNAMANGMTTDLAVAAFAQSAKTSREVRLVLTPHARVRGLIVANGKPVGGALVIAVHEGETSSGAISESDGTFVIDNVRFGKLRFVTPAYTLTTPIAIDVTKPVTDGVRLDVIAMARVHGRILRGGKPVAGADVLYMMPPQATAFGPPPTAVSDANGAYALEGLAPGPAHIFAMAPAQKAFTYGPPLELGATEDKTLDVELELSGEIKGTVVDETGRPVAAAFVRFDLDPGGDDNCETVADASGHFDCAMLMGGSYRPSVMPQAGARTAFAGTNANVTVPPNGVLENITLTVKNERFSIRGTVIDDAGAPLSDVHIEAISMGGPSTMDFPSTLTDTKGHFELTNLAAGTYNLHAHAGDGGDTEVLGITAGSDTAVIKLPRAGAIEGTLVGFGASPVVFLGTTTPDLMLGSRAMVDGNAFSRAGLAVGHYIVEARIGADVDVQTVEIQPGKTAHVEMHSRGAGTVEGTVVDATNKALPGLRCDAHALANGEVFMAPADAALQGTTNTNGQFTLQAPIGRVRITCFSLAGPVVAVPPKDVDVTAAVTKVTISASR